MTLRGKLLWAQAPLAGAMLLAAGLTLNAAREFGAAPGAILHDNFRSFDAGLTMLRAVDVYEKQGESPETVARFERALQLQASNITEIGEQEVTAELTAAWQRRDVPALRHLVDAVLRLNRDAMAHKAQVARRSAERLGYGLITAVLVALALAAAASAVAFRRILAPLRVLAQAARRLAAGDFDTRVRLGGRDEAATLAHAFNDMARHLTAYRKSSLGELLEANNRLQAVMDSLADAVIVYDTEGFPTSRNAAAIDLLGEGTLPDDLAVAVQEALDRVAATGAPVVTDQVDAAVEVPGRPTPRHLVVNATPVRPTEGVPSAVTVALRDVTRLRKLEGFRGDLVAAAAHELRTPLTSLHMSVHLCLEEAAGPLTPTQTDLLATARADCERLQAVVEELLEMARLEAGAVHLEREPVAVADLLSGAAEQHETRAQREGAAIEVELGDRLATVEVDLDRFRLVFNNLIDNALKHGGGPVRLSHTRDGAWAVLHIDDAGPGIPEALRERVFEKFFRVPGTPKQGTGLGLGLVRDLVRAHGGQVTVALSPAGGARFSVRLPLQAA